MREIKEITNYMYITTGKNPYLKEGKQFFFAEWQGHKDMPIMIDYSGEIFVSCDLEAEWVEKEYCAKGVDRISKKFNDFGIYDLYNYALFQSHRRKEKLGDIISTLQSREKFFCLIDEFCEDNDPAPNKCTK